MVHRIGSGEPQRAAYLYERLISEWWGVRLTLLRKKGFLHLRFRYFEKTESDFWLSNFLSYIFLISSHLRKNTALSCGVFAVHLFYQHILELMVGIEPTTFSLRVRCSAIEPHQRIRLCPLGLVITNQLLYRLSHSSILWEPAYCRILFLCPYQQPATCWLRISCSTDWATLAS